MAAFAASDSRELIDHDVWVRVGGLILLAEVFDLPLQPVDVKDGQGRFGLALERHPWGFPARMPTGISVLPPWPWYRR